MSRNIQAESCKNFEYDESGLGRMGYGCFVCLNYKGRGLGGVGDKKRECLGDCPSFAYAAKLRKDEKLRLEKYLAQGKQIAEEKHEKDGKSHVVSVIFSEWKDYLFGHKIHHERWLSLVVDDTREAGGKLGVGNQLYLAEFRWPPIKQKQQQNDSKGQKEA